MTFDLLQDKYILYCMVFNYLVTAWHAIVTLIPDSGTQSDCDLYFFIGFVAFYALFHIFFYAASLKTVSTRFLIELFCSSFVYFKSFSLFKLFLSNYFRDISKSKKFIKRKKFTRYGFLTQALSFQPCHFIQL
jgi:hypothetical protein